ncbi:MAG: hypothetical protein ACIAXF_10720 [Phycisphaerales bacterium JB063]
MTRPWTLALPTLSALMFASCGVVSLVASPEPGAPDSPIAKIGTIDTDTVETSPVVVGGKLYRFESVREGYHANATGVPYFHLIDVETGEATPAFAQRHALGSAYVEDDTMYVFGVPGWGTAQINVFSSSDLVHWEEHVALDLPGWELYNTSVCQTEDGYVMAFEVGGPAEVAGQPFTARFARSADLIHWELLPEPAVYTKQKYSACPTIRWSDGWYYMTHLEAIGGYRFETHIVRSRDLVAWESSTRNPVITFDETDKTLASEHLTPEQVEEIRGALNRNNSDIDYIEFEGQVVIYYSWGDQVGNEFLAQAVFDGTMDEFFAFYFPQERESE